MAAEGNSFGKFFSVFLANLLNDMVEEEESEAKRKRNRKGGGREMKEKGGEIGSRRRQ